MRRRVLGMLAAVSAAAALVLVDASAGAEARSGTERIAGSDRFATAAQIAEPFAPGGVVYVVTGLDFPDALAAGAAAAEVDAPVLLTAPGLLPDATAQALDLLAPTSVVVVGGEKSVSSSVVSAIEARTGAPVRRVSGAERFATAAAVSADTFATASVAYVASGAGFADALAGVPAAASAGGPLLLVRQDSVPASTAAELDRLGVGEVVVLGGTASVSDAVLDELRADGTTVTRVSGANRSATSAAVSARSFAGGTSVVYFATGRSFADALAAGPLAARDGGPLLLVRTNCVPPVVLDEVSRLAPDRIVLLGGERAVGTAVDDLARCPSGTNIAGSPSVQPSASPAWDDDGPDPHVVRFGTSYYAYTTGTTWGNNIGVLVSDRPDGGWATTTGQPYGSTALAGVPSWQTPDSQWAPAVYLYGSRYVLFYAAQVDATKEWCLSVASATDPAGPFHDTTSGPIVCLDHLDGVIDPHPFVDADGTPWLHFKNNDGFGSPTNDASEVSRVFAVRLGSDGMTPVGAPVEVLAKDTVNHPWQTTVDNPQMVLRGGVYYLFHTGGDYVGNDTYATGYATCAGPIGPCTTRGSILTSYGDVAGPGGGTVVRDADGQWWMSYHAWPAGCFDYSCGERKLYVAPLTF